MNFLKTTVLTGLALSLFSASSFAQDSSKPTSYNLKGVWGFGIAVEQVNFDTEAAHSVDAMVKDSATALSLDAEYFFHNHYSFGMGLAFLQYSDYADFSQNTTQGTKSSDASAMPIYADVGYKRFLGANGAHYVTTRLGLSYNASSSRSIANCSNCYEEDIELSGGFYGQIGAGIQIKDAWRIGIHYKQYFSGDFENVIGLGITHTAF
jgi:outer membrane protein W